MARRMRAETAVAVVGIRGLQVEKFRSRVEKLPESSEVYDFSLERERLLDRIAELEAGAVVHLQQWELAEELVPLAGLKRRGDQSGPTFFRIEGDELIPEERVYADDTR